ncbi:hypothetical protein L7F22_044641 [Adiantum nelumboides]|nr:hypothetical protein [Adiantum nelumboides]
MGKSTEEPAEGAKEQSSGREQLSRQALGMEKVGDKRPTIAPVEAFSDALEELLSKYHKKRSSHDLLGSELVFAISQGTCNSSDSHTGQRPDIQRLRNLWLSPLQYRAAASQLSSSAMVATSLSIQLPLQRHLSPMAGFPSAAQSSAHSTSSYGQFLPIEHPSTACSSRLLHLCTGQCPLPHAPNSQPPPCSP